MNNSAMNDTHHPAIFLTGSIPRNNPETFLEFLLCCKSIGITFPKDIRKMLWEICKIIKYNGKVIIDKLRPLKLECDFAIVTSSNPDCILTFNDVPINIGVWKGMIFEAAMPYTQIKIPRGHENVTIERWTLVDRKHPIFRLSHGVNSEIGNNTVYYHIGRLTVNDLSSGRRTARFWKRTRPDIMPGLLQCIEENLVRW